ncbi:MAG: hypothetical protein ACO1RX_08995 [Candidatus Sericytochromatia bacterium]
MTGVIPDTFTGSSSFLNEEIEYLEFESLIDEVSERLEANWSYDLDNETYQIEFIDDEGILHESVSVTLEFCSEGFNEGRDLIICSVLLGDYTSDIHSHILPDMLRLAQRLIFCKLILTDDNQLMLVGQALYQQEMAGDVITTMVEELSTLAADFRLKLESTSA